MPTPYTVKRLDEVTAHIPRFVPDGSQEVRFAGEALGAERTGIALQRYAPGAHPGFAHRHEEAEEIYVVLSGSGRLKLDDEIVEIGRLDAIRVAPEVIRSFAAGPDGLEILACGARHPGDGEVFLDWWTD